MTISEIKENIDNLETKTQDELIIYIHDLLFHIKRQESKNVSLRTEVRFLNKHLTKIKELIDKIQKSKIEEDTWKN